MEVAPAGWVLLCTMTAAAPSAKRRARRLAVEVVERMPGMEPGLHPWQGHRQPLRTRLAQTEGVEL